MSTLVKTPDRTEFLEKFQQIDEKWNAGDRSAYLDQYSDDSLYMPPNMETIDTFEGIKRFVDEFPDVDIEHGLVDLWGNEDIVNVHGTFKISEKSGQLMDKGQFLAAYRKDPAGDWKITHALWNSDLPLPG